MAKTKVLRLLLNKKERKILFEEGLNADLVVMYVVCGKAVAFIDGINLHSL